MDKLLVGGNQSSFNATLLTNNTQKFQHHLINASNNFIGLDLLTAVAFCFLIVICVLPLSRRRLFVRRKMKAGRLLLPAGHLDTLPVVNFNSSKVTIKFEGKDVFVKRISETKRELKRESLIHLAEMSEISGENINKFIGYFNGGLDKGMSPVGFWLAWEYAPRSSLYQAIVNPNLRMDMRFLTAVLADITTGLSFIHKSPIHIHGNLTTDNCVVDSRWQVKLTNFGIVRLCEIENLALPLAQRPKRVRPAPELLHTTYHRRSYCRTQKSDIYNLGLIVSELLSQREFITAQSSELVSGKPKSPVICAQLSEDDKDTKEALIELKNLCLKENPEERPTVTLLWEKISAMNKDSNSVIDSMLSKLESYSTTLEKIAMEKSNALEEERKKTELLLHKMLPRSVVKVLMAGKHVEPEAFEDISICFSDIVGFTTISAYSKPIEIISLLNELYTLFDNVIERYNVYKVETIGDAYMVTSGIPEKNSNHAEQLSNMVLDIHHCCSKFIIPHMPHVPLMLRSGLHSGSVVAGVVGQIMPRYCLFGDAVNIAARMESSGCPRGIHISKTTEQKLRAAGGYSIKYRGETDLKGRGKVPTYWLLGHTSFPMDLPVPDDACANHGFTNLDSFEQPGRKINEM